ncbi:hypothetical protein DID88_003934 [Monilinia fructigena]|uniref:Uncharacterized protein n=1 Tax=Monilinia fructigena TaxID=38457 RepID=A0A395IUJ2_9HELO|nr:hypothetical protein DID88_003934 [Monilinia fructigena]
MFKDGRRLVLVLFLLFSVMWAQIDFIQLLIPTTGTGACQAALILTTGFDQLARVALEQFLLWSIGHGMKITAIRAILQGILAIRLIVGGVLVGITRPQFAPTCVAETSVLPVAIVVLVMDFIIVGALLVQASSLGMFGDRREDRKAQSRALLFVMAGFTVWTITSGPLILGIPSISLIVRTVVPANGLLVLVGVITVFPVELLSPKKEDSVTAGARSPFSTSPLAPSKGMLQNGIGAEGSPIFARSRTKNQLFVVNPSSTPIQRDIRGFTKVADAGEPRLARDASGYQAPGGFVPNNFSASPLASGQGALIQATERSLNISTSASVLGKRPKVSVRGLTISKPMVNDETDLDTPFAKIATIDLKTAIQNDRERRAIASKKPPFDTPRVVPFRPRVSPLDTRNENNIFAGRGAQDQSNELMATSGLSTSASISPACDEVRRRSPRGINNLETLEEKQTFRPVVGLPTNPRSQISMMPQQDIAYQPETVMLMNDFVYDNPEIVESIISKTPGHAEERSLQELSPLTPYTSGFKPRESVIDRARPIPRYKTIEMFGSEPVPGHRRTKSSSSILNGKPFFTTSGSPSELPPLPKPPPIYTASNLKKLLPNDTKSMTFDEKIEFLFPAPPGVSLVSNRRSSVPHLPSMVRKLPTSIETDGQNTPISKRTTTIALLTSHEHPTKQTSTEADGSNRETYRSNAIESVSETLVPSHNSTATNMLKLGSERLSSGSRNASLQASTPLEENYMSQISPSNASDTYINSSYSTFSPPRSQMFTSDLTRLERMAEVLVEKDDDDDDDEGDGDEVMVVMMDADEVRRSRAESVADDGESFIFDKNGLPIEAKHSLPSWHRRIGDKLPAFSDRRLKLGSRKITPPTVLSLGPPLARVSPILVRNAETSPPLDSPTKALLEIQDQLNRIEKQRRPSLGSILRQMSDTEEVGGFDDENAIERLRLLENLEREMGEQENDWQKMNQNFGRDSMSTIGTIRTPQFQASPELARSIMETAPSHRLSLGLRRSSSRLVRQRMRDNQAGISAEEIMPSQIQESSSLGAWQKRLANAQMSYMENVPAASHSRNSSINFLSVSKASQEPIESPTPTESEPETEPASEYESEEEDVMENEHFNSSPYCPELLWQPSVQSSNTAVSLLWSSANGESSLELSSSPEPPAKNLRPVQRRSKIEMKIFSRDLWSKPSSNLQSGNVLAQELWGSTSVRAPAVKARPVTQRPPRRSKRITVLADIVENPEPLPNKRDTLGIFQFPWGERSDTAVPQPTYNPMFQAGPGLNATLNSRSRQLELGLSEYSSLSFFDDYDEEDEEGELEYEMDTESDDEFDETTLWEIASLLKTTGLPSKDSLLPPMSPSQEIIDDYDDYQTSSETDFTSENEDYEEFNHNNYEEYNYQNRNSILVFSRGGDMNADDEVASDTTESLATFDRDSEEEPEEESEQESNEEISLGSFEPSDDLPRDLATYSLLWTSITPAVKQPEYGLPQPTSDIWQSYIPASQETIRIKPRTFLSMPKITSCSLWGEKEGKIAEQFESVADVYVEPEFLPITVRAMTWAPTAVFDEVPTSGLFSVEARRQDFRSTTEVPAAIDLKKVQRVISPELPVLLSNKLWSLEEPTPSTCKNWMFIKTIKSVPSSRDTSHSLMWTPNSVNAETVINGLFQRLSSRVNYRTTEREPAALNLTSKARNTTGTLSNLISNKLWRHPGLLNLERDHDWISESSIRPSSPSITSEMSSGRSSPDISDASSIASTSTKASSLFPLDPISIRATLSAKKKGEYIPPIPAPVDPSNYQSKLPIRQMSLTPTPKISPSALLRQSNVLSSRDLFESRTPPNAEKPQLPRFRKSVVPMKPVKPAHRAIRHQYLPSVAFRANWKDALNEAIMAGFQGSQDVADGPKPDSVKVVLLETPRTEDSQIVNDFLEQSFIDATENEDHPAGPTCSALYNPALLHPVFFTENLVSDVDNIHPAAMGYTKLLRLTASVKDWDQPLGKAISKSTPQMQRPITFSFMWKDALKEAIAAGNPQVLETSTVTVIERDANSNIDSSLDVASPHSVFSGKSMMSSSGDICQEDLDNVKNTKFSSTVIHPVFFATTLVSTGADIHPACIGHVIMSSASKITESNLGVSKSTSAKSVRSGGMWTLSSISTPTIRAHVQIGELASTSPRRVFIQKTMELPTLESFELWQPSSVSLVSRNWLETLSRSTESHNFLFQKPVATVTSQSDALMWRTEGSSTPDLFSNIMYEPTKRATGTRSSTLPHLESSELFTCQHESKLEIDWLRLSVTPITSISREPMMWAASVSTRSLPDLFGGLKAGRVKRVPVTRPSIMPTLISTELFKVNTDTKIGINWLRMSITEPANQDTSTQGLNDISIEEPISNEVVIEAPAVGEPTFEELMADIETLTEEQIAELLGADEFSGETDTFTELIIDELFVNAHSPVERLWTASPDAVIENITGTWKLYQSATIGRPDIFTKSIEPYSRNHQITPEKIFQGSSH